MSPVEKEFIYLGLRTFGLFRCYTDETHGPGFRELDIEQVNTSRQVCTTYVEVVHSLAIYIYELGYREIRVVKTLQGI